MKAAENGKKAQSAAAQQPLTVGAGLSSAHENASPPDNGRRGDNHQSKACSPRWWPNLREPWTEIEASDKRESAYKCKTGEPANGKLCFRWSGGALHERPGRL